MLERYELAVERIREIVEENELEGNLKDYFQTVAKFLVKMDETRTWVKNTDIEKLPIEELMKNNDMLYQGILPENYDTSYGNPTFAVETLGLEIGQMLSFIYAELQSLIAYAYEDDLFHMTIRMELFLEIYHGFVYEMASNHQTLDSKVLKEMIYWFASDYAEEMMEDQVANSFDSKKDFAYRIIMESDLSKPNYLYKYGEYITENERLMSAYLNELPDEKIQLMADTYTEGYRLGFLATQKDISIKKTVSIRYFIGFERMVKVAIENFNKMGLTPIIYRAQPSVMNGRNLHKNGYYGAIPNKQFEYDHEYDKSLFFDKQYINRKLESYKVALESHKEDAAVMGGPAVIEEFGGENFVPINKKEKLTMDSEGQKLLVEFASKSGEMINQYVKGEERSFTIIAFPIPNIGDNFKEIFDEIIKINTLDYMKYQKMQQIIIDTLDQADYVKIKGCDGNKTDLNVNLWELKNKETETIFENCVADVNIPVGEVFTSPVLEGTNGVLHVKRVFLNGLEYQNLELHFKDGMITEYTCSNFEQEEENKKYVKENVLFHHDTLPMGEFAIGTNTTAYVVAKKYQIADILPILIAEKMGPHFAVGDTCYSHQEDMVTYNPDGKAIVARENSISLCRETDMSKAYYNCHTDITIPYDELGLIAAVLYDGTEQKIIEKGKFLLKGCEELNKPFDE